jgi:hypothetical protein
LRVYYHGHWERYGDLDVIFNFSKDWFLFGVDLIASEEIVENAQGKEESLNHLQLKMSQVTPHYIQPISHTTDIPVY